MEEAECLALEAFREASKVAQAFFCMDSIETVLLATRKLQEVTISRGLPQRAAVFDRDSVEPLFHAASDEVKMMYFEYLYHLATLFAEYRYPEYAEEVFRRILFHFATFDQNTPSEPFPNENQSELEQGISLLLFNTYKSLDNLSKQSEPRH